MATTPEYDALLARKMAESEKKRGHTHTQLSEAETQAEIERIQDGAKSSFDGETVNIDLANGSSIEFTGPDSEKFKSIATEVFQPKKRRGRPPGSRNRPKGHNPT